MRCPLKQSFRRLKLIAKLSSTSHIVLRHHYTFGQTMKLLRFKRLTPRRCRIKISPICNHYLYSAPSVFILHKEAGINWNLTEFRGIYTFWN